MFSEAQRRWLVLLAVMLAFLPVVIDMTILHIAVPSLTQTLGCVLKMLVFCPPIVPVSNEGRKPA
ncbi:hypothetical protein [Aeromonas salmonicida]|uniref:hypothetical protein n=1 Tax=Aeromonas salmonicida TaxID=645 RepID=UPI00283AA861|nr:hypothetical protein [Aeromonas salmonicida]